jgi:3-deoxy-D-manno-octulosonic-acid transferase
VSILPKLNFKDELARNLYSLVWILILPILLFNWLINFAKYNSVVAKEYLSRFGICHQEIRKGGFWLHCASVGEVMATQQLVERILNSHPHVAITISTNTMTGRERVTQLFGQKVAHVYLPYDFPLFINALLGRIAPCLLLVTEMELWPNLCHCSWKNHVPIFLVNGRMSEKSTITYLKLSWLITPLLQKLSGICAQSSRDVDNYLILGADKSKIILTNNIKFDLQISDYDIAQAAKIKEVFHLENRTIIVAGSTHETEEQLVIDAYLNLVTQYPRLFLILVPRHPQRFESVSDMLVKQNISYVRLSHSHTPNKLPKVLLADQMGVLRALYSLAKVAFVGGSLVPRGGHNALEPAALGVPVLMGNSTYNNPQICQALQQAGALVFIENSQEISQQITQWLNDETLRQKAADAGKMVVNQNKGAIDKTLSALGLL